MYKKALFVVLGLTACSVQVPVKVNLPYGPPVPVSWEKKSDDLKGGIQSIYGKTCLGTFMTIDQLGVQSRFAITIRSDEAAADMRVPTGASVEEAKAMLEKHGIRVHSKRMSMNMLMIGTRSSIVALQVTYAGTNSLTVQYIKGGYYTGMSARFDCQ